MSTIQAKDLARAYPASPFEELDGFPWLARLADKVRALQAGTLGDYTPYPCGSDQRFLQLLGLDGDALKAVIDGGASDEEVGRWVRARAVPGHEAKLQAYRQGMHAPAEGELAGYLEHAKQELARVRPDLDVAGVRNFVELICLEEGHPIPAT